VDDIGYLCFELKSDYCADAFHFCYKIGQDKLTFSLCDENEKEIQYFNFKKLN
jgi:hypothetical protein